MRHAASESWELKRVWERRSSGIQSSAGAATGAAAGALRRICSLTSPASFTSSRLLRAISSCDSVCWRPTSASAPAPAPLAFAALTSSRRRNAAAASRCPFGGLIDQRPVTYTASAMPQVRLPTRHPRRKKTTANPGCGPASFGGGKFGGGAGGASGGGGSGDGGAAQSAALLAPAAEEVPAGHGCCALDPVPSGQ